MNEQDIARKIFKTITDCLDISEELLPLETVQEGMQRAAKMLAALYGDAPQQPPSPDPELNLYDSTYPQHKLIFAEAFKQSGFCLAKSANLAKILSQRCDREKIPATLEALTAWIGRQGEQQ